MSIITMAVCVFGGIGSVCRYTVDALIGHFRTSRREPSVFPTPTLVINLVACLSIGVVASLAACNVLDHTWELLLATGFLGGFSTLSTAVNEMLLLAADHHWRVAVVYAFVCLAVPLVAVALGFFATSLTVDAWA